MMFYILLIYLLLLSITPKGYYTLLPSLIPTYPNNSQELQEVVYARKHISRELVEFHKRTDPSVIYAFYDFMKSKNIEYSFMKLQEYIVSYGIVLPLHILKILHNRKRPYQYIPGINLESNTSSTASYPAGHAHQAYILAKILSKEFPQYSRDLDRLAHKCDYVRVAAGLHYPSDGTYSKWLVYRIQS